MNTTTTIRLQKQLADAGYGSRREIEEWIRAGRLQVNGEVALLGTKVGHDATITLDGKQLVCTAVGNQPCRVIMYHKPEGEMCTRQDPENRPTVFDALPKLKQARWISIGRLDFNTSGLLLLTTDGELANRLMHPKHAIVREYAVRVLGELTPAQISQLSRGVMLEDGEAAFDTIKHQGGEGANQWYHVTIAEGRKREVRRLFETFDLQVSRLIRVRYGDVALPKSLSRGKWRDLPAKHIEALAASVDLTVRAYSPKSTSDARGQDRRPSRGQAERHSTYARRSDPESRPSARPSYRSDSEGGRPSGRPSYRGDSEGGRPSGRSSYRGDSEGRPSSSRRSDSDRPTGGRPSYRSDSEGGRPSSRSSYRGDSEGRPNSNRRSDSDRPTGGRSSYRSDSEGGRSSSRPSYRSDSEGGRSSSRPSYRSDSEGGRPSGRPSYRSDSEGGRPSGRPSYRSDSEGGRPSGRRSDSDRPTGGRPSYRSQEDRGAGRSSRSDSDRPTGGRPSYRSDSESRPNSRAPSRGQAPRGQTRTNRPTGGRGRPAR